MSDPAETRIAITGEADIVAARRAGRDLAARIGLSSGDQTLVATAISELARNVVLYAGKGEVVITTREQGRKRGVEVVVRDEGPGIADVGLAMRDGYSTGKSLGLGLPGARRLMDEFEVRSTVGQGTHVRMVKWSR